jgi:hypothetical protein
MFAEVGMCSGKTSLKLTMTKENARKLATKQCFASSRTKGVEITHAVKLKGSVWGYPLNVTIFDHGSANGSQRSDYNLIFTKSAMFDDREP